MRRGAAWYLVGLMQPNTLFKSSLRYSVRASNGEDKRKLGSRLKGFGVNLIRTLFSTTRYSYFEQRRQGAGTALVAESGLRWCSQS